MAADALLRGFTITWDTRKRSQGIEESDLMYGYMPMYYFDPTYILI